MPGNAPFELNPSPGKGWGAFATRRIKQGATILREKPLFVIRKPHQQITEEDVRTAFQHLTPSAKHHFLHLRDDACVPFTYMSEAFAENSFEINSIGPQAKISPGHGLLLLLSRFNHSCVPNSMVPITNDEIITIFATRDIMPGEEITFCYNTDFECRNRYERHQALRFICDCKACLPGTPFQQLSDMRRTFLRGLQYLQRGVDLNGQKQDSTSPIIVDPDLKKAAEDFRIPLSSRLIYGLLVLCLLDEEELLDDLTAERLYPGILQLVTVFSDEEPRCIARLAVTQKTWLEKFWTAFRLYGRTDAADHAVAERLRMLHGFSIEQ